MALTASVTCELHSAALKNTFYTDTLILTCFYFFVSMIMHRKFPELKKFWVDTSTTIFSRVLMYCTCANSYFLLLYCRVYGEIKIYKNQSELLVLTAFR